MARDPRDRLTELVEEHLAERIRVAIEDMCGTRHVDGPKSLPGLSSCITDMFGGTANQDVER